MVGIDRSDIKDKCYECSNKNEYMKIIMDYLLRKYKIVFNFEEREGYYVLKYDEEIILEDFNTSGEYIDEEYDELGISIRGWKVLLSSQYDKEEKSGSKYGNSENNGNFYEKNIKNLSKENICTFKKDYDVHRGHYIAKSFKNYLLNTNSLSANERHKVNIFFGKCNKLNIYYQTRDANSNSLTFHGQLYFENKILEFLYNNKKNSVRYIIEDILCKDKKSLGRILIMDLNDGIEFIFIPNTNKKVSNSPIFSNYFFDWNNS